MNHFQKALAAASYRRFASNELLENMPALRTINTRGAKNNRRKPFATYFVQQKRLGFNEHCAGWTGAFRRALLRHDGAICLRIDARARNENVFSDLSEPIENVARPIEINRAVF